MIAKRKNAFTIITRASERGEPVFVIRAQDFCSTATLKLYAALCDLNGYDKRFLHSIENVMLEFKDWQQENEHLIKKPD